MTKLNFRAFQKSTQKMLPVNSMKAICIHSERLTEEEFDDLIIMQSTGLFDKNGKEIFEGDVIKNNKGKIYKILFLYGAFYAYSIKIEIDRKKGKSLYLLEDISNSSEIIGNIYENPELLNS